jgi:hypothetical protein
VNILSAVTPIFDKAFYDGQDIEVQAKAAAKAMNDGLTKAWATFTA